MVMQCGATSAGRRRQPVARTFALHVRRDTGSPAVARWSPVASCSLCTQRSRNSSVSASSPLNSCPPQPSSSQLSRTSSGCRAGNSNKTPQGDSSNSPSEDLDENKNKRLGLVERKTTCTKALTEAIGEAGLAAVWVTLAVAYNRQYQPLEGLDWPYIFSDSATRVIAGTLVALEVAQYAGARWSAVNSAMFQLWLAISDLDKFDRANK